MPANNAFKTPYARSLNRFAQQKILDSIKSRGQALPCKVTAISGSIVTVSFEVTSDFTLPDVTIPSWGYEYIRFPIQKGCRGITMPADVSLGNITGMGTGSAPNIDMIPATLSALVFVPIACSDWSTTDDENSVVIYGPDGVIIRDTNSNSKITLTTDGTTITNDVTITDSLSVGGGAKAVALMGDSVIGGKVYATSSTLKAT